MTVILDDERNVLRTSRAERWCGYGLKFTEVDSLLDLRKGFLLHWNHLGILVS